MWDNLPIEALIEKVTAPVWVRWWMAQIEEIRQLPEVAQPTEEAA